MKLQEDRPQINNTVLWSKDNCPYCTKAKMLLNGKGIKFEERKVDGTTWTRELLLEAAPNAKTFPQIWLHGKYIGGCDQLEKYFQDHDMWRND